MTTGTPAMHWSPGTPPGGGNAREVVEEDLAYIVDNLRDQFSKMDGGRLLITGGAGFLGYYLVQAALAWNRVSGRSISLTVYDRFLRGMPAWLQQLDGEPRLRIAEQDISRPLPPDAGDFDYVIHAASIASPTFYRLHPIETMDANVIGLRTLLDHAREHLECGHPPSGFLYFSTSEIYGDPTPGNIPTPETYRGNVSSTGPRACYDESKRFGETLCVNFARTFGLPITIARPFNNYGPGLRLDDRRVIPDFARDVLAGRDIVLLSDGSPTRTFNYIADAVIGYYRILVDGRPGEAYNIGAPAPEVSIAELAGHVTAAAADVLGYRGQVVQRTSSDADYLTDNPQRRRPSIAKAQSELGYDPQVPLEDGLRRTLTWYAENQDSEAAG